MAGLCTGTLAATAVACSRNVLELVPLAVDAVNAAFRVGEVVADALRRIVMSQECGQSWSLIIPGHNVDDLVRNFSETSVSGIRIFVYMQNLTPSRTCQYREDPISVLMHQASSP